MASPVKSKVGASDSFPFAHALSNRVLGPFAEGYENASNRSAVIYTLDVLPRARSAPKTSNLYTSCWIA